MEDRTVGRYEDRKLCKGAKVKLSLGRGYVRGEEVAAVGGPGVLGSFEASGLSDLEEFVAMRQRPDELLLDGGGAAWRNKQAVLPMTDEVGAAGAGRAEHGHATSHGLEDDEAEAFRDRGQYDEIASFHVRGEFGVG